MKLVLCLLFATGFMIQSVAGIICTSFCAACWKDGSPGVDIKMSCDGPLGNCYSCPAGYSNVHCAQMDRCMLSGNFFFFFYPRLKKHTTTSSCREPNCKIFGPCYCGINYLPDGRKACKVPFPGQECTSWFILFGRRSRVVPTRHSTVRGGRENYVYCQCNSMCRKYQLLSEKPWTVFLISGCNPSVQWSPNMGLCSTFTSQIW